jgi:hypothetical protein
MTMVVRPRMSASSAAWTARSLSVSRAEVASSRSSTGASLRIARAIAMRWRWPPESFAPFSPISVRAPAAARARIPSRAPPRRRARSRLAHAVGAAIGDVGGDRVVEEHHVLRDERDLAPQALQRERLEVVAVERDAPASGW